MHDVRVEFINSVIIGVQAYMSGLGEVAPAPRWDSELVLRRNPSTDLEEKIAWCTGVV